MALVSAVELDVTGLRCPEPLMLVRRRMRTLRTGEVMQVIATDPTTTRDIPSYCSFTDNELLEQEEAEGVYRYWLKKG